MKTIPDEPKPEEILKVKYSNDKWEPDFKGILEAMREYAEVYHKAETEKLLPCDVEILLTSSDKNFYKTDERRIGFQQGAKWLRSLFVDVF